MGADGRTDGGGRDEGVERLLSTHCRLRVRGTGTVSRGLAGVPSLAPQTLAFIFRGKKPVRSGAAVLYTEPTAGCHGHTQS